MASSNKKWPKMSNARDKEGKRYPLNYQEVIVCETY